MSDRPEVWLIYPEESQPSIRGDVKSRCEDEGWSFRERHTAVTRLPKGRSIRVLSPDDATNLYRSIHTRRIGVWQFSSARAPTTPQPKMTEKNYMPLSRFVRYKAFHCQVEPNWFWKQLSKTFASFESWAEKTDCEGESDPRCLPFHVFETDADSYDLGKKEDRKRFQVDYGPQSSRRDGRDRIWSRPNSRQMHGTETLRVAGRELTVGFHWDVSSERKIRISNTFEVWEIKRNGYVNVYPNAHIRGSSRARPIS